MEFRPESIEGARVRVKWRKKDLRGKHEQWFSGKILKFNSSTKEHEVLYDNGRKKKHFLYPLSEGEEYFTFQLAADTKYLDLRTFAEINLQLVYHRHICVDCATFGQCDAFMTF